MPSSLGNRDHVNVSVWLTAKSKTNAFLHSKAFDYSRVDCENFGDHLRYVPWFNTFKLGASAAAEFCEWVHVLIDV